MPRRIERPHFWRSALLIFAGLIVLAVIAGLLIQFGFTPYDMMENMPEQPAPGQ
ncbi:MAG: hypothetical protein M3R04_07555 [bacterium]|nr:hypothetical protein [bacterium]